MNMNHDDRDAATRGNTTVGQASTAFGVEQAITVAFGFLDRGESDRFAAAFAENGSWSRRSGIRTGRNAIMEEMHRRPPRRLIRHLICNFVIAGLERSSAEATFISLAFADDHPVVGVASAMRAPIALDEYRVSLTRLGDVWLISELSCQRLFEMKG